MFPQQKDKPSNLVIFQIFTLLFVGSIVWAIEKFFLLVFTTGFNERAYAARIEHIQEVAKVLENLSRGVRMRRTNDFTASAFFSRSNNSSKTADAKGRKSNFKFDLARRAKDIGSGVLYVSSALLALDVNDYSRIKRYLGDVL
jgi:hypothetical protein